MFTKMQTLINDPDALEQLYRRNKREFVASFGSVFAMHPDSILLQAWRARLEYGQSNKQPRLSSIDLIVLVGLCFLAGFLLELPLPYWAGFALDKDLFFSRYFVLIPFATMAAFTLYMRGWPRKNLLLLAGFVLVPAIYIPFVPELWDDVFSLACLHMPFFFWYAYGLIRNGQRWRESEARIEYIRFSGEMLILSGLLLLGGIILFFLTSSLFDMLNWGNYWLFKRMGTFGMAAIPLVAAWATDTYSAARRIVPLMARIFAPLLLVLIVAYMLAMAWNLAALFHERNTLQLYNILLFFVLITVAFTLTERRQQGNGSLVNGMLGWMLAATLVLDVVGICAIGWRIWEYGGFTPNRLAVLGFNLVVSGNLTVLLRGYWKYWRGNVSMEDVEKVLASYLPVYGAWAAFAIFVLPWIFRY